jgi:hypothetical protein
MGYLGFFGIDFLKSVLMYAKGAICLSRLLFKMGLFTVCMTGVRFVGLKSTVKQHTTVFGQILQGKTQNC